MTEQYDDTPLVSIICIAYNHEKYIRQALDGFIKQKTSFKYEIIVHDDASSDGTASIIAEYEKRYPDRIRAILQTENQHSKGVPLTHNMIKLATGKYIAFCEGDDFWTDENKLSKQVKVMEEHNECVACCHNEIVIKEDGSPWSTGYQLGYREHTDSIHDKDYLKNNCKFCHTASLLFRADVMDLPQKTWERYIHCKANGDMKWAAVIAAKGKIYHIAEDMACYRYVVSGNDSWTARNQERNIAYSTFVNLQELKNFVYDEFAVKISYSGYYDKLVFTALRKCISNCNKTNLAIFVKLITETNFLPISVIRLILFTVKKAITKLRLHQQS